jgi:glycosyltransferase involved in cell wall biosynthesis
MRTLVHVTHEAVQKVGGIGAVLQGLITSKAYNQQIDRTVLIGPLFTREGNAHSRLGPDGEVFYSSIDGILNHPTAPMWEQIERDFKVDVVYGRRTFYEDASNSKATAEVVLIDVHRGDFQRLNAFKSSLYSQFGIESNRYEDAWDFDQYVKLAEPAIQAVFGLGLPTGGECVIVAHEFMGMPTALAAIARRHSSLRTVFYAHEVATVRKLVEEHPGHDTMFYNVLAEAMAEGFYLEDMFGNQHHYFKHALVEASRFCDNILAVGDYVIKELRFLDPDFDCVDIDLSYNGIPAFAITPGEAEASRSRLRQYCENLLGYRPDYVFTHVSRLAPSKGLWRDVRVLEHVEQAFRASGKTGVCYFLNTEVPRRRPEDIYEMEQWWDWPVAHREGMPDMSSGEAIFYTTVQRFNARSRNVKAIFVNQFGWERALCGSRMPEDMDFWDIRKGADVEFGLSIYEPFGIAQLEALSVGGICVISNVCGCAGLVDDATEGQPYPNVIVADFTDIPKPRPPAKNLLTINRAFRNQVEDRVTKQVADELVNRLPDTVEDKARLIESGYELAQHMTWEVIARKFFLPAIDRACRKQRVYEISA